MALAKYLPALKAEGGTRFYQSVDAITDDIARRYPRFLDQLLTADGAAFIPSLRFYAITGTAKIITPKG